MSEDQPAQTFEDWWRGYMVHLFNQPDPIRALPSVSQAAEHAWHARDAELERLREALLQLVDPVFVANLDGEPDRFPTALHLQLGDLRRAVAALSGEAGR